MAYEPFDLTGKKILVTGGNGGIGLGIAEGLVQAGADVCIWGTSDEKNAAALDLLRRHGTDVSAIRCDIGDEAEVTARFSETLATLGRVDACFANAAVATDRRAARDGFVGFTDAEWHRVTRVNLDGTFFTIRAVVKHMLERGGGGSLVLTSSLVSIMGMARGEHYAATKGAINAMVKALAVEYGPHGIRANAILPGWIKVDRNAQMLDWDRMIEATMTRVPLGRWGEPADFAGLAIYLASDASAYHTGDLIVVDGAYSQF